MVDQILDQPSEFNLMIQGALLDNLGINMYANLGKCLVEFAANAYDSDSPSVEITLEVDEIAKARRDVRKAAIDTAKRNGGKVPTFVDDPLPSELCVKIVDKGHGMAPSDIQQKFLPINRNRRRNKGDRTESNFKTEAGKRYVMGRKGIGKLSGFGAASRLVVETKRKGMDYKTRFVLDLAQLRSVEDLSNVAIKAEYFPADAIDDHGTTLTLENLKCDSMKFELDDLHDALADAFYPVRKEEFDIKINGEDLRRPAPTYTFTWPAELGADGYADGQVGDDEVGLLPFRYVAHFRNQSLKASKRGARVYCNNRLAFGPSLVSLNTGTHNFMAHQYMEFIVQADELDRQNVDLISTDRADILRNSNLVDLFLDEITTLMTEAIKANGKDRETKADDELKTHPKAKSVRDLMNAMSAKQRGAARKIVNIIVARYGIESAEFETIAPLLMTSMNAGEVLVDLIKVANNPQDIANVTSHLVELRQIERSDALKIFRGRRDGIAGLRKLVDEGEQQWRKGPRTESELHALLKQAPWLLKPELSNYVTSDRTVNSVLSSLSRELVVDDAAPSPQFDEDGKAKDPTRPDLVFLLGDSTRPDRILIVELKSTDIPLEAAHLSQLERYMRKVEAWLRTEFPQTHHQYSVEGMLIGAMPASDTKADGSLDLLDRIRKRDIAAKWEVIGLHDLLARTQAVNRDLIRALEAEDAEEEDDETQAAAE